ncbi:MAG: cell division protein ZapA [Muribaculaceae bacterium]|nr:cell division protein ZapA [Muribaculaceae bacterium]
MATDKDIVKIEINIAGEFIVLSIPFDRQDNVRRCEKALNERYSIWRQKFPRKTPSELIAMLAYQYASFFYELTDRYDALTSSLRGISSDLDRLLDPSAAYAAESEEKINPADV